MKPRFTSSRLMARHRSAIFFWLCSATLAFLSPALAFATSDTEAIRVTAAFDSPSALLKTRFRLTLTIAALAADRPSFRLPRIAGWLQRASSVAISKEAIYLQGRPIFRQTWTHTIEFEARKTGSYTFPSIPIKIRKTTQKTEPLRIDILDPSAKTTQGTSIDLPFLLPPQGEIFLLPLVSHREAFVGQQILVAFYLVRRPSCDIAYEHLPRFEGFWTETLFRARSLGDWQRRMIQGQEFWGALVLRVALFPLQPGQATIDPLILRVRAVASAESSADRILRSPPLSLRILPLPPTDQPPGFSASQVGRFTLQTRLQTPVPSVGQPLLVHVTLRGSGNLRQITLPPPPSLRGFRFLSQRSSVSVFERASLLQGELQTSWIYLPETPGSFRFPPVSWSSFDPQARRYERITTDAFPFTVAASTTDESPKTSHDPSSTASKKAASPPSSTIQASSSPGDTEPSGSWPPSFRGIGLALLPLALLGWLAFYRRTSRSRLPHNDESSLLSDYQDARQTLQRLLSSLPPNPPLPSDLLLQIEATLLRLAETLLHIPAQALSLAQLHTALTCDPRTAPLSDAFLSTLRHCQDSRFSPSLPTDGKDAYFFSREIQRLLDGFPPSLSH